ncbi:MAG: DISARM system phospholipase D-like protein DrmC, partial [Anaerolineae bacterium]|nr:DISARM system phospholipase D-like protein DrmC [Anaerolineae bacterium]
TTALITAISKAAGQLPAGVVTALAAALETAPPNPQHARYHLLQVTPTPQFRAMIEELVTAWQQHAPNMSSQSVALALRAGQVALQEERERVHLDLTWTGPSVLGVPLRRTDQALLEVIQAARSTLLIVSFAVYKIQAITSAIIEATAHGVAVRICIEAPEVNDRMGFDTAQALGPAVLEHSAVYIWPRDKRPTDPSGKVGSLHVKCAVADSRKLFISSANLTDYAMNLNMELGVLIEGGPLPGTVATQFNRLIQEGIMRRI